jgi:hypothetical protein
MFLNIIYRRVGFFFVSRIPNIGVITLMHHTIYLLPLKRVIVLVLRSTFSSGYGTKSTDTAPQNEHEEAYQHTSHIFFIAYESLEMKINSRDKKIARIIPLHLPFTVSANSK